jgi:EpsD family peptidyl-prolyl cis-trans isomerase
MSLHCRMPLRLPLKVLVVGVCAVVLADCSKKADDQAGTPKGQVIAHVGKDDVTIHELENEFRLANIPQDKRSDAVVKRVLSDLVQRKLLVQQAVAAKLDREPTVFLDILRSREQILASTFVQRTVQNKATAIGKSDIDQYVANNPIKFSQREAMVGEQITFPLNASSQAVIDATKDAKALDEIDKKLTDMGIVHSRSVGTLNSADLPEEVFKTMQAKKADDVFFFRTGSNGIFFKLKNEESRPVTGEDAQKLAKQALTINLFKAEAAKTAAAAESQAKYEGDYARIMGPQEPAKTGDASAEQKK